MPNFTTVKNWIKEAAREMGARCPDSQAKALAGAWITQNDGSLGFNPLTYSDPTGEQACKAWFKAVAA